MIAMMGIGTVITQKTAAGYLKRIAKRIYNDLDMAGSIVFDEEAKKIVAAGWLTWEEIEKIEIAAMIA